MQLSELFRRGIIVPLTDDTEAQFSQWSVDTYVSVEYLPIQDDAFFELLWKLRVFQSINESCSTLIDDYEEEVLKPEFLSNAISTLMSQCQMIKEPSVRIFIENMIRMCNAAKLNNRSVYFIF